MTQPRDGRPLTFYFDYISHNAYLAWSQLPDLAQRFALDIEFVPVLFAGLLNAHGQLGPAEVPAKAWWMAKDVMRKAALLELPLAAPASHPFNPLLALRVSSVPTDPAQQGRTIGALFEATWARSLDVGDPATVTSLLDEAGLAGADLGSRAGSLDVKARLRAQTDAAIGSGIFGVPSMRVGEELFWGFDDLPHLELFLRGQDPLDAAALESWRQIRPSARRPRPG